MGARSNGQFLGEVGEDQIRRVMPRNFSWKSPEHTGLHLCFGDNECGHTVPAGQGLFLEGEAIEKGIMMV